MGNQHARTQDSSPKWSCGAEVEPMASENWGQVQCYSPHLATFSLGWLLPPRIYPHLPVSKQKHLGGAAVNIYGAGPAAAMKTRQRWTQGTPSAQTTAGSGCDSFSVSVAMLQPFPYLINNSWLGMFYLYLQMKAIFQPDALASWVTVTCSKHCVVPSALAHSSSSFRLQQQRGYWSLKGG